MKRGRDLHLFALSIGGERRGRGGKKKRRMHQERALPTEAWRTPLFVPSPTPVFCK